MQSAEAFGSESESAFGDGLGDGPPDSLFSGSNLLRLPLSQSCLAAPVWN